MFIAVNVVENKIRNVDVFDEGQDDCIAQVRQWAKARGRAPGDARAYLYDLNLCGGPAVELEDCSDITGDEPGNRPIPTRKKCLSCKGQAFIVGWKPTGKRGSVNLYQCGNCRATWTVEEPRHKLHRPRTCAEVEAEARAKDKPARVPKALKSLMKAVSAGYPDGLIMQSFEGEEVFDGLAKFLMIEVQDSFNDEPTMPARVGLALRRLDTAIAEIEGVRLAVEKYALERGYV